MAPDSPFARPEHPAARRLEAVAAGDTDAGVAEHIASCEPCARYVASLGARAATFAAQNDPAAFVARAAAGSARRAARSRWTRLAWAAPPVLAAAAAVLLVARARPTDGAPTGVVPAGDLLFKGSAVAVAVIRERDGAQDRLVGPFEVRAGDRVRVEVSAAREEPLAAGLLEDDGQWVPLLRPTLLEAGTHYSELAARFDASPTRATLLAGEAGAVDRARTTRDFTGVVAWRVTSEPSP